MNIGTINPTPSGELLGTLAIMSFDARIGFMPVASANERAPKFEVMALNVAKRWVRIGALWEKEAASTGEVYLTGHIDDPSLPSKLYVAAFRQSDDGYAIAWTRAAPSGRTPEATGDVEAVPAEAPLTVEPRPSQRRRKTGDAAEDDPFA